MKVNMKKNAVIKMCTGMAALVVGLGLMTAPDASAATMALRGYVYLDCNNNGIFDPGEQPITGVEVTLIGVDENGAAVQKTALTRFDGQYFIEVIPGTYSLFETQPAGVPDGKDTPGRCTLVRTENDAFIEIAVLESDYAAGNPICGNYNFGELCEQPQPGSIGDTVFCDANDNGVPDAGEGISGVRVVLSLNGAVVAWTDTGANGQYLFPNLLPGDYVVAVDTASVLQGCSVPKCLTSMPVTLAAGQVFLDADFCFTPPPPPSPGTGTPGYWKTHPDAWPVNGITIGGIVYTKDQAIQMMWQSVSGDKRVTMFNALVCAKLNVIIGNASSCIAETIMLADQWMAMYGSASVAGSSTAWKQGEPLYLRLDAYNNGLLCAPHRD